MMLKYERIAQDITSAIANDEYNVGDKLPSVEQLKARYKVSKSTIIKALAILQRWYDFPNKRQWNLCTK